MADRIDELDNNNLSEENKRLKLEIKKLTRQLNLANDNMQKYKSATTAKENLSAIVVREKSKQDKQIQIIMENTPDIIFLLDSSMNFLLSTKSFLTFTGIPAVGLLLHQSFRPVFAAFSDDKWLDHIESVFKRSLETNEIHSSYERLCIGAERNTRTYSINVIPFAYSGEKSNGLLVIFHDITEHIEMENKLKEALNQANIASKAKGVHRAGEELPGFGGIVYSKNPELLATGLFGQYVLQSSFGFFCFYCKGKLGAFS